MRIPVIDEFEVELKEATLSKVALRPVSSAPPLIEIRKDDKTIKIIKAASSRKILKTDLRVAKTINFRS
jgi:hypothetical protein